MASDRISSQQKQEGWYKVAKLCEQAQAILVDIEEGPFEQVKLDHIERTARIQVGLWS